MIYKYDFNLVGLLSLGNNGKTIYNAKTTIQGRRLDKKVEKHQE